MNHKDLDIHIIILSFSYMQQFLFYLKTAFSCQIQIAVS